MLLFVVKVEAKTQMDIVKRVNMMNNKQLLTAYLKLRDEEDWGDGMDEQTYLEKSMELKHMIIIIEKRGLIKVRWKDILEAKE